MDRNVSRGATRARRSIPFASISSNAASASSENASLADSSADTETGLVETGGNSGRPTFDSHNGELPKLCQTAFLFVENDIHDPRIPQSPTTVGSLKIAIHDDLSIASMSPDGALIIL